MDIFLKCCIQFIKWKYFDILGINNLAFVRKHKKTQEVSCYNVRKLYIVTQSNLISLLLFIHYIH